MGFWVPYIFRQAAVLEFPSSPSFVVMVLLRVFSPYPFSITFPDNFMVNPHVDISWYSSKFSLFLSFLMDFFHQISMFLVASPAFSIFEPHFQWAWAKFSHQLEPTFMGFIPVFTPRSQLSHPDRWLCRLRRQGPGQGLAAASAEAAAHGAGRLSGPLLLVGSNRGFPGSSWGEYNGI